MNHLYKKTGGLESLSVTNYEAFKFYRENSKNRDIKNTENYVQYGKILSKFYSKIGEKIVQSEAGVFIEGLGYFSGIVDTVKSYISYPKQDKILLNRNTSGYKFFLIFVPIAKDITLRGWVADSNFSVKIRKDFSKALKDGKKFKFNPSYFINKYSNFNNNND